MAKQRDAIRMTPAEIATLYDQCKSLQVATLDKDGAPAVFTDAYLYVTFILKDVSYDPAFVSSLPHVASARFNAVSLGN